MTRRFPILLASLTLVGAVHAAHTLDVVATTPDYAALVRAVGGDAVSIKALAKPTEDPHFVDARPSHIVALNRSDLLIESGADLELGWLPPLIQGARNAQLQLGQPGHFLGSQGIALLDVPTVLDRSQGDIHAMGNPHFLMDPENARIVARNLAERLCELAADGCPAFRANLAAFEQALGRKEAEWDAALEPYRGTPIVTYHNTWKYFARRFGLVSELYLEPKPGIPPSPPHLAEVIAQMRKQNIRVILVEPFQSRKTAEKVAAETGAEVVDVCQFPGGLPQTDGDYLSLMDANVRAVAAALGAGGAQ